MNIALVDPLIGGHHFAFMKLFTESLHKLGHNVIILMPKNELLNNWINNIDNTYYIEYEPIKKVSFPFNKFIEPYKVFKNWKKVNSIIDSFEKEKKIKCHFVFFNWMDFYISNYLPSSFIDLFFSYKWAGLYFHPWYLFDNNLKGKASFRAIDSVFNAKKCIGVAIHDEFLISKLNYRIKNKALLFPEIADDTSPDLNYDLPKDIVNRANGRVIIGLIGLSKRKGTKDLVALSKIADKNKFFFFFAGQIPKNDYSDKDFEEINRVINSSNDNIYYFPQFIEEGAKINSVICAIDILYLVYDNFKSSSNYNTKAAIFKKHAIGTNRFWIGNSMRKYNLGPTVDEGDINQQLKAIELLAEQVKLKDFKNNKFEEYMKIHHVSNLDIKFKELIGKI